MEKIIGSRRSFRERIRNGGAQGTKVKKERRIIPKGATAQRAFRTSERGTLNLRPRRQKLLSHLGGKKKKT